MMAARAAPLHMLTFAPMIDSEFARLLLAYYAVPYQEDRHLFGLASILALRHGGTGQVPLIYGNGRRLSGPRAIVDCYDPACPAERRLIPPGEPTATHVEADMNRFNGLLATDSAVFAYFHLLPHPDIMIQPFCLDLPIGEANALRRWAYAPMRWLLSQLLRLSPARAADALVRLRSAFDYTDRLVADGRRYIAGSTVTLGDFALASAVAPLLQPSGYGAPMPPLDVMPAALASIVVELRARPTATLVQRIYADHPPHRST